MKKGKKHPKGFTLLEILVVLVILGVVAGLAIPVYTANVQRSYQQEAIYAMGSTRASLIRYYAQNTAAAPNDGYVGATLTNIDYRPNTATAGQALRFSYTMAAPTQNAFTISATRNATAGGDGSSTLTMIQDGTIAKGGVFV